jgi:hypothetical protein
VKITPHSGRKKGHDEDTDVVLVLAPFSKYPKLVFHSVKVGTSKRQNVIVRNPNDSRVEVCQYRLYETSCKCRFDLTKKSHIFVMPVTCRGKEWSHLVCVACHISAVMLFSISKKFKCLISFYFSVKLTYTSSVN